MSDQTGPAPAPMGGGYLSVDEIIERAPSDLEERDVEVWGGKVRVRGLTVAQAARIHQGNVKVVRGNPDVNIAAVQIAKFELGVVKPKLTHDQVVTLHKTSGAGFTRVVGVIDELSGMSEEELRDAQQEFPDSDG